MSYDAYVARESRGRSDAHPVLVCTVILSGLLNAFLGFWIFVPQAFNWETDHVADISAVKSGFKELKDNSSVRAVRSEFDLLYSKVEFHYEGILQSFKIKDDEALRQSSSETQKMVRTALNEKIEKERLDREIEAYLTILEGLKILYAKKELKQDVPSTLSQ